MFCFVTLMTGRATSVKFGMDCHCPSPTEKQESIAHQWLLDTKIKIISHFTLKKKGGFY